MKTFITILMIIFVTATVKAQTENTGERLITQLKNGTVPGWKFAPNVPAAPTVSKTVEQKESLITQIRKGTAPGMKFLAGTTGAATVPATTNRAQTGTLASELPVKKETLKTIVALPPIPTQEEVKQENKQ
jgi:hypothetical protein